MAVKDIMRDMNLYADGIGFLGAVAEYTPPVLTQATQEYRGGGMAGPVHMPMGLEAMEAGVTLNQFDKGALKLFGKRAASTQFEVRGALQDLQGNVTAFVHKFDGRVDGLDQGTWSHGGESQLKLTVRPHYYQCSHGGEVVHEIDMVNGVVIIGGVDQSAAVRAAIGV